MSMPTASLQPYIRQATEHQRLAYTGGAELAVILDATITGGQLTVIDTHSRRGDASPVHVHRHDDEAFLLLDGQMTVWAGDQRHILRPGGIAFLPPQHPARGPLRHRLPGAGAVHPGRTPGGHLPGGRQGPGQAGARGLAANSRCGPQRCGAGREHGARATPRARRLTAQVSAQDCAGVGTARYRLADPCAARMYAADYPPPAGSQPPANRHAQPRPGPGRAILGQWPGPAGCWNGPAASTS